MQLKNGFTLLELLIALTLSTMVILLLAMGMNVVLNDWERSDNRLENSLDKVLILLNIERALEGAYPHTYFDKDDNKRYIFFEGKEESIAWVSTVSPGRHPGLQIWQLSPNKENDWVQIKVIPAFAGNPTERLEAETDAVTILEGYKATFEYLYKDEKLDDETEWLDKWSAIKLQGLPSAVRISLETDGKTEEEPLEIVAVIQANQHQSIRPIKP